LKIADSMGMRNQMRRGLSACLVGSIGPTTSEELREQGIDPDFEPTHPKMGFLVREAAEHARRGRP
jgi:uroporphyrinogen-III synthase